ncbi:MAG: type II toxin-antitoxin system VapC family toxin [Pseudomonadota bacterium]|nr:type II toxin-antitoxin system VapC family toxin [Pseudomonadota bacterium]
MLDSNVLVAMVAADHEHHAASVTLWTAPPFDRYAIAAHSYAEAYSTLTRGGRQGQFGFSPHEALGALDSVRAATVLVGLTAAQTFDAMRDYARGGGIGARLYDRLIGEAAAMHGIGAIVTWNLRHMRALFPDLTVVTPEGYAAL